MWTLDTGKTEDLDCILNTQNLAILRMSEIRYILEEKTAPR